MAVEQRPHFANGLVSYASDDAADGIEDRIGRAALVPPIAVGARQLVGDGVPLAVLVVGEQTARRRFMLHVVDPRSDIDQRLKHRMRGNVLDALAVDVDLAAIANGIAVFAPRPDHGRSIRSAIYSSLKEYPKVNPTVRGCDTTAWKRFPKMDGSV